MAATLCTAFLFAQTSAQAQTLFVDDFDTFALGTTWDSSPATGNPVPTFLSQTTIDGRSVLRMTSVLSDLEATAITTTEVIPSSVAIVEVDFKTMPQFDSSIPAANQENIDGLLGVTARNEDTGASLDLALFGGNFGDSRIVNLAGATFGDLSNPAWEYNTWYRFVIVGTPTTLEVSLRDELDNLLFSNSIEVGILSPVRQGGFRIELQQFMGTPGGEYYTDVAIDRVAVTGAHDTLVDVDPDTLNINSHGQWITAYLDVPAEFNIADVDVSTIQIAALLGPTCDPAYTQPVDLSFTPEVGDRDEDGILDLTVKFDRQTLQANLCLDDVGVLIQFSLLDGTSFGGTDVIRVISRGGGGS